MAGEDRESKSKHKKHKKHSSSKKSSHKHKSEHKHRSSRHHRHDKHKKKHHKHKEKKNVDDDVLQNAIESLEVLEGILKASGEFSPEELMSQVLREANAGGGTDDDTEDSSSDSDADLEKDKEGKGAEKEEESRPKMSALKSVVEIPTATGKGSSDAVPSGSAVEAEPTKPKEVVKENEPLSTPSEAKEPEGDVESVVSKEIVQKADSKSLTLTDSTGGKPSSSSQLSQSEHDSDSSSAAETSEKTSVGGTKDGVFKPFSKKLKVLGSKTSIKINIRPKEDAGTTSAEKTEGEDSERAAADGKSNSATLESKSKSAYEGKREHESKRERKSGRRSRTRSRSRTRHGHSRHSRSRSRSPRRHRSRSRSYSRSRRSRRGRSRSRSRYRSRSRSRSGSRPPTKRKKTDSSSKKGKAAAAKKAKSEEKQAAATGTGKSGGKKKEISQLTAFCKDLQAKQAHEDVFGESIQEEEPTQIHHPFAVQPATTSSFQQPTLVYHNNAWKTTNQLAIEASVSQAAKPLVEKFPFSTGLDHTREDSDVTASENVFAKYQAVANLSMTDLVAKRLQAQRQILINPADIEAHRALSQVEQQTSLWAESKVTPGQYTGQSKLTALSKEAHNTGIQAWAKKKMFRGLAPVGDGFGMKMLMKMGWRAGQPIGKQGQGHVEPICLDVKLDRSGLATDSDWKTKTSGIQPASVLRGSKNDAKTASMVQGKHPVSALQELCAKKRWDPPRYELKEDAGPAHLKMFLYQVSIPLGTFQPAVGSNNKKLAKMQAATAALQGLGLVEKTIEYTSS